jgi:putative two-component system response regulator
MIQTKPRILIVDDENFYIDVLVDLLKSDYKTIIAKDGQEALKRVHGNLPPDLILLDILMPGLDGYQVCEHLKSDYRTRRIPIIFLTVKSQVDDELRGFGLGAADYIIKPMSPPIVKARVRTHLALSQARRALENQNTILEQRVRGRTEELSRTQDAAIMAMACLAEARDHATGQHILRTQHYMETLARQLQHHPRFYTYLNETTIELLYKSAPLHDMGKVAIADHILFKKGELTPEEWEEMRQHPRYGHDALLRAEQHVGSTPFLKLAREIAYTHHEKWDGTGYPQGLQGDAIPIPGRLMALADTYDGLVNPRVNKNALSHTQAVRTISEGRGSHFDPDVVDAFLAVASHFESIAARFRDS